MSASGFACPNITLLLPIPFPSFARLPGTAEGWICRGLSPIEWDRDTQRHDPASDTCPWYRYNLPPLQNPPVSLCQHGLQPGTILAKVLPQPLSSPRLFLSYFWLVSSFLWQRQSHSPSQYLTLQGFSRPSQQVSSKSLFAHSLWAGGRKRHRGYNDCCYDDYDDYRRRRRRSALERGPLLDTLEDRGGYRKVRQNGTRWALQVQRRKCKKKKRRRCKKPKKQSYEHKEQTYKKEEVNLDADQNHVINLFSSVASTTTTTTSTTTATHNTTLTTPRTPPTTPTTVTTRPTPPTTPTSHMEAPTAAAPPMEAPGELGWKDAAAPTAGFLPQSQTKSCDRVRIKDLQSDGSLPPLRPVSSLSQSSIHCATFLFNKDLCRPGLGYL